MFPILKEKLFYKFIRDNKKYFIYYILIITIIKPIKSIIIPKQYGNLFDAAKSSDIQSGLGIIKTAIYCLAGLWVANIVLDYFKNMIDAELIPRFLSNARNEIFRDTIHKHSQNYKDVKTGEYITRIYDLTRELRNIVIYVLEFFYPTIVVSVSVIVYYMFISKKIGCIVLISLIILIFTSIYYGKRSVNLSAERESYYLRMTEKMNDSLGNLMNVYLNNQDKQEIQKNKDIDDKHTELYVAQNQNTEKLVFIMSIITVLTMFIVIWMCYTDLKSKTINSKTFTTILLVFIYYVDYMFGISWEIPHFLTKLGIIKNSLPFLEEILLHKNDMGSQQKIHDWTIECRNVSFRYQLNLPWIYHDMNISIQAREKVAFMGKSGMGKTTLAKLLLGIYRPTHGDIIIGGQNQKSLDNSYLRNHINYINQRTNLFNETVMYNLQYGNNQSDQFVTEFLKKYKLLSIYDRLEKGLYNMAGVQGGNLSQGMQKITILVRGLLRGGNIIIFDEPLTSLDFKTRELVMNMIKEECRVKTVLIITHDREVIPYVDRVIHMEDLTPLKPDIKVEHEIDPEDWIYGES